MQDTAGMAAAIVGVGAILPDAPDVEAFWRNVREGRYSISEVTPDRWDPALYYDPDPRAPDKTYSKIGGWVREWAWDPMAWRLPIPPKVGAVMDDAQKWAVACTRAALADFGYPQRPLDNERTAVVLGNAMSGEQHYLTSLRIYFPEFARELAAAPSFGALPEAVRQAILAETRDGLAGEIPGITEDTMPGELANCIAGRIANLNNFRGPNYVVDAACASAMAAMSTAVEGLTRGNYDAVVTGGIDRNMGANVFVKFCKIGALSATGTRPYADGADGFVMGEGASVFLLKRLADAERDGDRIYAVVRSLAGSSDGKGKGITAPNPVGQRLAVQRAWRQAGEDPATVGLVEGHGTSTRVGDVVEVESLMAGLEGAALPRASVPLGSVKSNIGHLKGGAGGAGLLKAALALHDKVLPPSLNFDRPNPNIDFAASPFYVNTELREWKVPAGGVRRAGVSAFGFGGTNYHAVLEEHVPGRLTGNGRRFTAGADLPQPVATPTPATPTPATPTPATPTPAATAAAVAALKRPLRGALVVGEASPDALNDRLVAIQEAAVAGRAPTPEAPTEAALRAPERVAVDYADAADLADKATKALRAASTDNPAAWKLMRNMGVFRGGGEAPKVAFLYTGQGSQYVNMLAGLRASEPIVAETFAEADQIMEPLLGRPLSDFIFVDPGDPEAVARVEEALRQTAITQPAVLAADTALTRLLAAYGIGPDMVMGHSLGEYGALIAAGALPFEDALEAVSARGREMTKVSVADNGRMAAVFAPLPEIERVLATVDGYVVVANINSTGQAVVGGASDAVERAIAAFQAAGHQCVPLPVSHAFHTSIVAPASEPLRQALTRLRLAPPILPIVANVDGELYPMGPGAVPEMLDILARQVASPVQFVKGLHTLYDAGVRVFVEVGPKRALQGFADDVFADRPEVLSLFTNHPKNGEVASFNQALCGLYAAGLGVGAAESEAGPAVVVSTPSTEEAPMSVPAAPPAADYGEVGRMVADVLERGFRMLAGERAASARPAEREAVGERPPATDEPVVITGAALGTPGTERIFDDANIGRLLRGEELIDLIPTRLRQAMLDKHITRLVKREDGDPTFETIDSQADVIKLAARGGAFDPAAEFGVSADRVPALDSDGALAVAAGIDALRDAGIPLVLRYKTTSRNTQLPDRWNLPDALRDSTGVIFASAFPGLDGFAEETHRYHVDRARREQLQALESVRARLGDGDAAARELDRRIGELRELLAAEPYVFDRRFLFRCLSMGHAQFAEMVGARGPNTQINSACASTTQAVALAEDWIRAGRCRRVVIVAADDATSDHLMEWIGAGFLASGAAATDDVVAEAATPFDRRRHGMIIGMGAAALVVESAEAARERGVQPICEVLGAVSANSAFHGTRLDVDHISQVMEELVGDAERRWGIRREEIAPRTVFVSHETYTPARGGSAAAEVHGLRRVFGEHTDRIVVANTKGFTGHPMGVGIEDVVAVKSLETGLVPPVPNYKEVDPDLGRLNLSVGGSYPVDYALRLAAGFGSQLSLLLLRWVPTRDGVRRAPSELGFAYRVTDPAAFQAWLRDVSGRPDPELEVDHRRLRVKDRGAPAEPAQPAAAAPAPTIVVAPAPAPAPAAPVEPPAAAVAAAPPAAATAVAAAPAPEAAPAVDGDPVQARVLALVSEETGYPPDMLDLDLDLEADLGVDTVKQAEIFASIRESYGIERDASLKLRDFPTLADVIRFVHERAPAESLPAPVTVAAAPAPAPVEPATPAAPEAADGDPVQAKVLALVSEETGYPPDMLDLDLDLEADLGVDTVKQAEIFAAIRESYAIERDPSLKLRDFPTLADVIRFVHERAPAVAAPAAEAPAAPEAATVAAPAVDGDPMRARVLALVSEETGYPPDMLDLDLDLEADLGVDTVKQAEIFASIRESYGIERDASLKLRDFPTLADVIRFVHERAPAAAPVAEATVAGAGTAQAAPEATPAAGTRLAEREAPRAGDLEAADRVPRRVPVAVLRPPLELCRPTGVTVGDGSRVLLMADRGGVAAALAGRLGKLGVEVLLVDDAPDADTLRERIGRWTADGPIHGVYWLPALDAEPAVADMDLGGWREHLRVRVKLLYAAMRALGEQVGGPGTFLVAGTRLGGRLGYDDRGATAPMGGAVSGFVKAFKRERPDALVKVVDLEPGRRTARPSELLIEETLQDPGAVEVGREGDRRWTVTLAERPAADGQPGLVLTPESVLVVTGAAGSIVSAIVTDLAAAAGGGTFHLLDLAPEPDPDDEDTRRFAGDRDGLKRDLAERMRAAGERPTPALIERQLAGLERRAAALAAIEAIRAAGGTACYHSVDLTDADAVAAAVGEVRERHGRVDALVHAAGLEISRLLPDKEPREFDLVFDVKSDGWFNLLHALGDLPVGATVAFSSIAGRFGNAGQTDYSAANDLLCKSASALRRTRPQTRAIAIDWTAWAGIGMATRGSIPKMMELAGIDMLPPEAGVPTVRRELVAGGVRGEVLVGGRLGVLGDEWDPTGGLDTDAADALATGPMLGHVIGMGVHRGIVAETTLDPTAQPFLDHHRIDGTAVLPGVMGVEGFAELAALPLPGWRVAAVQDVRFLAAVKFYRDEPRTLTLQARLGPDGDDVVADCRLTSVRRLANQEEQATTHFTGRVRLTAAPSEAAPAIAAPAAPAGATVEHEQVYRIYFHGPAYQVVERAWRDGDHTVGLLPAELPPNHEPATAPLAMAPRLIELCFQAAGVHQLGTSGQMALPERIGRVAVLRDPRDAGGRLLAVVTRHQDGTADADVVDEAGQVYVRLEGYGTVALSVGPEAELLQPLEAAMA